MAFKRLQLWQQIVMLNFQFDVCLYIWWLLCWSITQAACDICYKFFLFMSTEKVYLFLFFFFAIPHHFFFHLLASDWSNWGYEALQKVLYLTNENQESYILAKVSCGLLKLRQFEALVCSPSKNVLVWKKILLLITFSSWFWEVWCVGHSIALRTGRRIFTTKTSSN